MRQQPCSRLNLHLHGYRAVRPASRRLVVVASSAQGKVRATILYTATRTGLQHWHQVYRVVASRTQAKIRRLPRDLAVPLKLAYVAGVRGRPSVKVTTNVSALLPLLYVELSYSP